MGPDILRQIEMHDLREATSTEGQVDSVYLEIGGSNIKIHKELK